MNFMPLGGGREIGANCFILRINNFIIMLDCGRHPVKDGYESLPEIDVLERVDFIIISHSHYDHLSSLPYVLSKFPDATVFTSKENRTLALRILSNSVEVMKKKYEKDGEPVLYSHKDVKKAKKKIFPLQYMKPFELSKGLSLTLYPAGHVMGASSILIEASDKRVFYTGDISLSSQLTVPEATLPDQADIVISEGTYGLKETLSVNREMETHRLSRKLKKILESGGRAMLPVFALGRGQEALYMILKLIETGKIPRVPVYINGMVHVLTDLLLKEHNGMDPEKKAWFKEAIRRYVNIVPRNASSLIDDKRPMILILSSGMLIEDTLSYIFAHQILQESNSAVYFMGYQSPESPGFAVLEAFKSTKKLELDEEVDVLSDVDIFNFSGHASYPELLEIPRRLQPEKLIYVHGDEDALENLREELQYEFQIEIPENLERIAL
ncbi:beta-lactamase [Kosmotoga arenicorallina S304]|uniref:Beta-lactamase n=1 Tax=Kosmotoga arenicorallina S304 TaxID=1453497 RepID=A0A176K104_9BACT|nr:MBL fold metallo-hydrolase [Kosmotoga arenicorallina]OAA30717.1 beta-lactamase [Kosmotoga arenicorallina S304]